MPIGESLLIAGASLLGQGINVGSQANLNKKTRQWNEKMYWLQRTDALNDRNWQTSYDAPSAQMARLRAAGLNPNLIYDNGRGASGAAAQTRSTPTNQWSPHAPQVDPGSIGDAIGRIYEVENRSAQTDNLKEQNKLIAAQVEAVKAGTLKTLADTKIANVDYELKEGTFYYSLESAARDMLNKITTGQNLQKDLDVKDANIKFTLSENERAQIRQTADLKEQAQRVLTIIKSRAKMEDERRQIQATIDQIKANTKMTEKELELWLDNINKNDPWYIRSMKKILEDVRDFGGESRKWFNKQF